MILTALLVVNHQKDTIKITPLKSNINKKSAGLPSKRPEKKIM